MPDVSEIKSVTDAPMSHPFNERLIGSSASFAIITMTRARITDSLALRPRPVPMSNGRRLPP